MPKQMFKRTIADKLLREPMRALGKAFTYVGHSLALAGKTLVSLPYRLIHKSKTELHRKHGEKLSFKTIVRELEITAVVGVLLVVGIGGVTSAAAMTAGADFRPDPKPILLDASGLQSLSVGGQAEAQIITRDSFEIIINFETSISSYTYLDNNAFTNNIEAFIQWPFLTGVPITDGYGTREKPCPSCTDEHNGVDFTPGAGSEIQSISEGRVVEVVNYADNTSKIDSEENSGGTFVIIEHDIDGHKVRSWYLHMQYQSSPLKVGDTVGVGQLVGKVGNTGKSTGAHLHLSIQVDGKYVNPYAWLVENNK